MHLLRSSEQDKSKLNFTVFPPNKLINKLQLIFFGRNISKYEFFYLNKYITTKYFFHRISVLSNCIKRKQRDIVENERQKHF